MIIDAPRSISPLKDLWRVAFGDPDGFIDDFFALAYCPQRCLCAYEADRLAGALYWFDCTCGERRYAYLYAVATHPDFRGQGVCRQLMTHTHALLQALGYAGAVLVPGSPELFTMYEKFGYRNFGGMRKFSCTPTKALPITPISPQEYARLRRTFLPEGGLVQEGDTLRFFAGQVQFYTTGTSLLCAAREKDTLFVPELLGDPATAGGILAALGCAKGNFRTPGTDPFAMCLCWASACAPAYFGIALD